MYVLYTFIAALTNWCCTVEINTTDAIHPGCCLSLQLVWFGCVSDDTCRWQWRGQDFAPRPIRPGQVPDWFVRRHGRDRLHGKTDTHPCIVQWLSSQICNVCALLETSTKFGILVDMVATITICYRTISTAPPGGWSRHPLNVGTCCHINVITLDLGGIFSFCFQICIQEMCIDYWSG